MKNRETYDVEVTSQVAHVLGRFDECPIKHVDLRKFSEEQSVPLDFIVQIIIAFGDTRHIDATQFEDYSVEVLVDYLQKSHDYYRNHYIPQLYQAIDRMENGWFDGRNLKDILEDFVSFYVEDLEAHFHEEERGLFPYALVLTKEKRIGNYSLDEFKNQHNHADEELNTIREVFLNYVPKKNSDILTEVFSLCKDFEIDMHVHGFIEDHVLLPRLQLLENELKQGK